MSVDCSYPVAAAAAGGLYHENISTLCETGTCAHRGYSYWAAAAAAAAAAAPAGRVAAGRAAGLITNQSQMVSTEVVVLL